MKKEGFERGLLEYGALMKRGKAALIGGTGKIIAAIAAVVAVLATFMDVKFFGIGAAEFSTTLAVLLISGYVIYFSLEDAGEHLGEESEKYRKTAEKYDSIRAKIDPEMIPDLRKFLNEYSAAELEYRRKTILCSAGLSAEDLQRYKRGESTEKHSRRALRSASRLRSASLSVQSLLSSCEERGELYNPERKKLLSMSLKLLPSTACMLLTASVILTTKADMTVSDFIDGLIKLATLPILAFRGYEAGYAYTVGPKHSWLETKIRLLECFLDEYSKKTTPEPPPAA